MRQLSSYYHYGERTALLEGQRSAVVAAAKGWGSRNSTCYAPKLERVPAFWVAIVRGGSMWDRSKGLGAK